MTIAEAKKKLVDLAKSQVGYHEGSGNQTKYASDPMITKLYGWNVQGQPWCCTFVNWTFMTAFGYDLGSRLTYGGTAACSNSAQLFKSAGAWKNTPEVGDQAFFLSGGGINHAGIVAEVNGSSFTTIEGNYSDKVSSVRHNTGASDVAGFGRPNWSSVQSVAVTDGKENVSSENKENLPLEKHDWTPPLLRQSDTFKPDVVVLQALLNVKDFPCGDADGYYGPKTATAVSRAQYFYGLEQDCICGPKTWSKLLQVG